MIVATSSLGSGKGHGERTRHQDEFKLNKLQSYTKLFYTGVGVNRTSGIIYTATNDKKKEVDIKDLDLTGNHAAFERVFKTYFKDLHAYAFLFLKDNEAASEAVQQVFFNIWEKKQKITVQVSIKAYLYKSVYNECMLQIKKKKRNEAYRHHRIYADKSATAAGPTEKHDNNELKSRLHAAINELPEQCRIIFQLNRFEGLKYAEIAAALNLSLRTVENQMGKALKRLRQSLAEFLPLLIFLLWNL